MRGCFVLVLLFWGLLEAFSGPSSTDKIAIIGAGPSGVSIAYQLVSKGYSSDNIVIFEQSDRIGGFVRDINANDTIEAITAFGASNAYWSLLNLLPQLNLTACPYNGEGSTVVNVTATTNSSFFPAQANYLFQKYGLTYSNSTQFSSEFQLAAFTYKSLYSSIMNTTVGGPGDNYRSPYLFPRDRPSDENLALLSQLAIPFLVSNNIQILEPLLRLFVDNVGYGPLDNMTTFHLFTWIHPSVVLLRETYLPCEGFQVVLEQMVSVAKLNIIFNSTVTQVTRYQDYVDVTNNGTTERYDWIILTNKPNSMGFVDLRQDEIDLFSRLVSTHVRLVAVTTNNASIYAASVKPVLLPLNYNNAGTDWTVACRNDHYQRYPYDTTSNNFQCFQAFYNRQPPIVVTQTQMDNQFNSFMTAMNTLFPTNAFTPFTIYSSFETEDYFFRVPETEFSAGIQWDLFELQGKNRTWFVSSAFAGMESIGHLYDYSNLLTDIQIPNLNTGTGQDNTRTWINVKEYFNLIIVTFSPEWFNSFNRHGLTYQFFSLQTYFWWFIILMFLLLLKFFLLALSPRWNEMTRTQKVNVIIYALELIFSTFVIIWFLIWCAPVISFSYIGFQSYEGGFQYNGTLGWIEGAKRFSMAVGYGVIPMTCLYMIELVLLSSLKKIKWPVFIHHAATVTVALLAYKATLECMDVPLLRLSFFLFLDMIFEQPCFIALLLHRFKLVRRMDIVWACTFAFTLVYRVVITAFILAAYYFACWDRLFVTNWVYFMRIFTPFLVAVLVMVQSYVLYIYFILSYKLWGKTKVDKSEIELQSSVDHIARGPSAMLEGGTTVKPRSATLRSRGGKRASTMLEGGDYRSYKAKDMELSGESSAESSGSEAYQEKPKQVHITRNQMFAYVLVVLVFLFIVIGLYLILAEPHPFNCEPMPTGIQQQNIAIIGGGIAGLSAAWNLELSGIHSVTIFESSSRLGGQNDWFFNPNTGLNMDVVTTRYVVFHNLYLLFEKLGILGELVHHESSYTYNEFNTAANFSYSNIFPRGFGENNRFDEDIGKFGLLKEFIYTEYTIEELRYLKFGDALKLGGYGFSKDFIEVFLPMAAQAYGFSSVLDGSFFDIPVYILFFYEDHIAPIISSGLRFPSYSFANSTRVFIDKFTRIIELMGTTILLDTPVLQVRVVSGGKKEIELVNGTVYEELFDQVIIAAGYAYTKNMVPYDNGTTEQQIFEPPVQWASHAYVHDYTGLYPSTLDLDGCWCVARGNFLAERYPNNNSLKYSASISIQANVDFSSTCLNLEDIASYQRQLSDGSTSGDYFYNQIPSDLLFSAKNLHKIQGKNGIWWASGDHVSLSTQESAHIAGLVISTAFGATYPYENTGNTQTKQSFLKFRAWMLWGIDLFSVDPTQRLFS